MTKYGYSQQRRVIRDYLQHNPGKRPVDVARTLGVSVQAVSLERREMGLLPLRTVEARKRRMTVNELDAAILQAVYGSNLVTAVLDDGA